MTEPVEGAEANLLSPANNDDYKDSSFAAPKRKRGVETSSNKSEPNRKSMEKIESRKAKTEKGKKGKKEDDKFSKTLLSRSKKFKR